MDKTTKLWLMIAASLVLAGCIIVGGVMCMLGWDFAKLSTVKYETNCYDIQESFKHLSIVSDSADIVVLPSQNGTYSVTCHEQKNLSHSVCVTEGTLVIRVADTRKWYDHIGIHLGTPQITVSIPQGEYGSLTIKNSTGNIEIPEGFHFEEIDITDSTGIVTLLASAQNAVRIKNSTGSIRVENISAGSVDLTTTTGKITASNVICPEDVKITVSTGKTMLANITCQNLISKGNTGNISLTSVIAAEAFSIQRTTGDIRFDGSDAAEILIKTDTGSVTGSLLTTKTFIIHTSSGHINVPKTTTGGKCEITTSTGDIKIEV